MTDAKELAGITDRLRSGHDILPFMTGLYPAAVMQLQPLPREMEELLEKTPDYLSPRPGDEPTWLQLFSGNDAAELVLYRARVSGALYVAAPDRDKDIGADPAEHGYSV